MTKTLTSALALGLLSAPAFAGGLALPVADPVAPAAPVAVAPAPVAATGSDWTGFYAGGQLGYGETEADDDSFDDDGSVYGAQLGYDYDFGKLVLGGEISYAGTEIEDDATGNEIDGIATAKLRAGYDAGVFLPYVTAGYASAYTSDEIDGEDQFDGYVYGAGVDYKVTENVTVGAEVLKHEFEDLGDTDLDATTAAARVSYRF